MDETSERLIEAIHSSEVFSEYTRTSVLEKLAEGQELTHILRKHAEMSESSVLNFYGEALDIPIWDSEQLGCYSLIPEINLKFCRTHTVLALTDEEQVFLVTARPEDSFIKKAAQLATGKAISLRLALPDSILNAIEKVSADGASISELSDELDIIQDTSQHDDVDRLKDLASEAPIVKLVNALISQAINLRASDIHIEPFENRLRIRYRVDGVMRETKSPPLHSATAIISRIKIMARLNIAERRLPQDGRIHIKLLGRHLDLRISTMPSLYGEGLVMRILDKEQVNLDFKLLGLAQSRIHAIDKLIHQPYGIILVTGPTGSGKTTTLYTALNRLNSPEKKIMTVEDPVEYQLDGIMQLQVKPNIGLNFADALRAIVRQDPDIVMIGEMRDFETATIAIQSSLTGHLVFSTLHTNDSGSAITRLTNMGVDNYLITSSLMAVIAQRLVRTLCDSCKQPVAELPTILQQYVNQHQIKDFQCYEAAGCDQCDHSGYVGRTVIMELMLMDDTLRQLIHDNSDGVTIQSHAMAAGMVTIQEDGFRKVLSGLTSLAEVIRVTQNLQ